MKKRFTPAILILISFLLIYTAAGQTVVIDIGQLKITDDINIIPDVNGKVLMTEEKLSSLKEKGLYNPIVLYPGWPLNYTGSTQRGGMYCKLDSDDDLEIVYNTGQQAYAWNIDGSVVDGWPVSMSLYADGAPAYGDIDGDGESEVVISTRTPGTANQGTLYAFEKNGSPVSGFPVTMSGGATKTPVLADLNGDGVYEIIVEERDYPTGFVGVYKGDGTSYPGFPVEMGEIPGSAVAVGDINGDNIPEIVAESYYNVYVYDNMGNLMEGFPYSPGSGRVFSYSSPVLADMDGDGNREILVGDHSINSGNGAVHVIHHDGTVMEGWPKTVSYWIYGPPAIGDIDGDGNLDVAVGDQVLSGSPADKVYVWDKDGNLLPGWPTPPMNAINNQIILADVDGDDEVELIWDDNTGVGSYIGYNHDGTVMAGWPLSINGSSFFNNPFITDINNDGIMDMSGAGINLGSNQLYFYLWNVNVPMNPEKSPLTILQYNVRHDGAYVMPSQLAAAFIASPLGICEGGEVQFTDQSTGNITSWEWTFEGGDPATSTDQNPLVTYASSGIYDVTLVISDGTSTDTLSQSGFIHVDYDPEIPETPTGPDFFHTDTLTFTLYETTSSNADEYIWELSPEGLGVITPGDTANQVKIYWTQDESYFVDLHVKALNICGESDFSETLTIYVNWDVGMNDEGSESQYRIYPNPNNGNFTLWFNREQEVQSVILLNSRGAEVVSYQPEKASCSFDNLTPGLYFLRIEMDGREYLEKVVVQ